MGANLFRRGHGLLLEIGSRTDLIGMTLVEEFVCFSVDAPPYPARNKVHAGEDSYLEISVRSSQQRFLGRVARPSGGRRVRYCPAKGGGMLRLKRKTFSGS